MRLVPPKVAQKSSEVGAKRALLARKSGVFLGLFLQTGRAVFTLETVAVILLGVGAASGGMYFYNDPQMNQERQAIQLMNLQRQAKAARRDAEAARWEANQRAQAARAR